MKCRSCNKILKFYSQYGQDVLLNQIFKEKESRFFVEVGCLDGKRFSNTLTFEKKGWKGLCVEAHRDYIDLLIKNRPNSIICHCAAGDYNENNVIFYANKRGSFSTLDPNKEELFKMKGGKYFTGFEKQLIKKRRLDYLFKKFKINQIDILSIDIEGSEIQALRGIDFKIYKPRVIVLETNRDKNYEKRISKFLLPFGYKKSISIGADVFYLANKSDHKKIYNKKFIAVLNHTKHPFSDENESDIKLKSIIDTTLYFSIKSEIMHTKIRGIKIIKNKLRALKKLIF